MNNKYTGLNTSIFSIFGSSSWIANKIPTFPENYNSTTGSYYIRVSIIPANAGINIKSISGILNIDIFISEGQGPQMINTISDKLDAYLVGASKTVDSQATVQFENSSMRPIGLDKDNPTLYRALYTIPFNFYSLGV